ncbi:MAG TPA: hypothetical protein VN874_00825 [Myxococcales bacterium]|jgi:hypothetical protein|nr:hypothetical protein [Myxococcales bacterium]
MIAALTLWLLAAPGAPLWGVPAAGLPGDLLFLAPDPGQADGDFFVDAGAPPRRDLPAAPHAGLSEDDRLSSRRHGPFDAPLPMNLSLETWQGTLCVKGAWSIRASAQMERTSDLSQVFRDLQISPALIADGARLGPGIGASTRF